MAKKINKTKFKKIKERKSKNNPSLKDIEFLKKNLLEKSDSIKKEQKGLKIKKKRQIKKKFKIKNNKSKEKKNIQLNRINTRNVGDLSLNKNNSKSKLENKKKENNQTLLQLIKNKQNLVEVKLAERINIIKKSKIIEKDASDNKISSTNSARDDKNEYMKKLKSKISIINGQFILEKPDVGLINKKDKEEHNINSSGEETNSRINEKKINSLSFLNIEHTKKWSQEETNLFYKAIELFGLDFSFLEIILKPRKRIEIKRKYLKEKKENPKEIEKAIYARKNLEKLNKILNLYKTQNSLGLSREESFKKKNENIKEEKIDFNKEYKNILNK